MRILVCAINFAPESVGAGKYTSELCIWLASLGHDVRVVTAPPWFPEWRIPKEFRGFVPRHEIWHGLRVIRVPICVPSRSSALNRMALAASFAAFSLPQLAKLSFWRPQLVWIIAPSLASTPGALACARMTRAATWLHVQDFEIDVAFELGLLRGGVLRRLALALESNLLRRFDRVSSISERMLAKLHRKGVAAERTFLLPNWVDVDFIRPMQHPGLYRDELGIGPEAIVALYSGSMGVKQGLDFLAAAAHRLKDAPNIHFVFCGQGPGLSGLAAACQGLPNIHWLPLQPAHRLCELLNLADIHLLPQRVDAADLVLPSKLVGMLASGRPIVTNAAADTTLAELVSQCGVVVAPDDVRGIALAIESLAASSGMRQSLGARGREIAVRSFSTSHIFGKLADELRHLEMAVTA